MGNCEQSFIWNKCGFRLYVSEGALSSCESCIVAVKALIAGRFDLPKNTELVSGLYAISSSQTFLTKVKIEIQHCVVLKKKAQCKYLQFIKAHQTQPGTSYHFSLQEGGEFSINSYYGGLWQSEFSIVGAVDVNEQEESGDDDTDDSEDDSTDEETSSSEEESSENVHQKEMKENENLVGAYEDDVKPKTSPVHSHSTSLEPTEDSIYTTNTQISDHSLIIDAPVSKKQKPNRKRGL